MHTALLLRRRLLSRICAYNNTGAVRCYASGPPGKRNGFKTGDQVNGVKRSAGQKLKTITPPDDRPASRGGSEDNEATLYEQLFGKPTKEQGEAQGGQEELPRLPFEQLDTFVEYGGPVRKLREGEFKSKYQIDVEEQMRIQGRKVSVLVLRNASKNLVEDDFRRLIPQGEHLESWTMEQGDILKIIPGRDMTTLEREDFYYLLFSSQLSAFTYQGHATRVHSLAASHTPSTILSPIMPPPGYMTNHMDANKAIKSFSLVAPNHELDLRQLKSPLSPLMQTIVRNQGYPDIVARKDRMPYEARLTIEGPQIHLHRIQQVFRQSGRQRALSWSGTDKAVPPVVKWEPSSERSAPAAMSKKKLAQKWGTWQERDELRGSHADQTDHSNDAEMERNTAQADDRNSSNRKATPVYIVGFETERDMYSFVHYWHRRPLQTEEPAEEPDIAQELPPIANVEALW